MDIALAQSLLVWYVWRHGNWPTRACSLAQGNVGTWDPTWHKINENKLDSTGRLRPEFPSCSGPSIMSGSQDSQVYANHCHSITKVYSIVRNNVGQMHLFHLTSELKSSHSLSIDQFIAVVSKCGFDSYKNRVGQTLIEAVILCV